MQIVSLYNHLCGCVLILVGKICFGGYKSVGMEDYSDNSQDQDNDPSLLFMKVYYVKCHLIHLSQEKEPPHSIHVSNGKMTAHGDI